MKTKKIAALMISASLAMGTIGSLTILANPPEMNEQFGEMPDGGEFNGERPELPDGESFNGERTELPDGENFNGERPELPDGESFNGERPELPDGESFNGERPEMPDGENFNSERPELPDGENFNGERPELPNGEMPEDKNMVKVTSIENGNVTVETRKKPDSNSEPSADDAETTQYDFSSAEILKEEAGQTVSASLSDITSDSMLKIELNEDGSVKTVIIKEKMDGKAPANLPSTDTNTTES